MTRWRTCSRGTLCFYGPPGTGKTALAEYLARELDRSLLAKRASDIVSMWLGETERNIAEMFREAKNENAVLFLDEADSFLRDRRAAVRSWEVSEVNELLQQMERFSGIFICATNLFESLDPAALRRFTFKISFNYLTLEQRLRLFAQEAGQPAGSDLAPEIKGRLARLTNLTPGDFATVCRQALVLGDFTHSEFIDRLEEECRTKDNRTGKGGIGFVL